MITNGKDVPDPDAESEVDGSDDTRKSISGDTRGSGDTRQPSTISGDTRGSGDTRKPGSGGGA